MPRSAAGSTVVMAVAVLLPGLGSGTVPSPVMDAVFWKASATVGRTRMVICTRSLGCMVPIWTVTVLPLMVPAPTGDAVTSWGTRPGGRVSVTTTP